MSDLTAFLLASVLALIAGTAFYVPITSSLRSVGLERSNFRGERVVTAGGLFVLLTVFLTLSVLILLDSVISAGLSAQITALPTMALLFLICGVSMIGLVDDLAVGGHEKGLGGHLKAFFEGRITTGFLKAGAGLMFSLIAASVLSNGIFELVLNTLLLAVSINLFNIFDLRPGRSMKLFLLGSSVSLLAVAAGIAWPLIGAIVGACLIFLIADLRELAMLGDAGANMLGAIFGFLLISSASLTAKVIVLLIMLGVELIGDRYSLSKIISANPVLNAFDQLGRRPDNK